MDSFAEQIVPQDMDVKRTVIVCLTVILALALNILTLFFFPYAVILTLAGGGYLAWRIIASQSWEVEYSVTNGDIDIDRIIGKSRRKRLVQVRGEKIESLLPATPQRVSAAYDRVVMAARSAQRATWCFTYHSKKNGKTLVLFEPDEDVWDALCSGLSPLVRREAEKEKQAL